MDLGLHLHCRLATFAWWCIGPVRYVTELCPSPVKSVRDLVFRLILIWSWGRNTCKTNSIAMFRCTSPITFQSHLGAIQAVRLCSLVFQAIFSTVYVVYSRYWMWRHGWSTTWDLRTASPTLLPIFTGCVSQSGSTTRSLCWHTKLYTEVRRGTMGPLVPVADLPSLRTLRSGSTSRLLLSSARRSTVSDWSFTVAGHRVWNTATSRSLSTFRQWLKTWLFRKSFPDIIIWTNFLVFQFSLLLTLKYIALQLRQP